MPNPHTFTGDPEYLKGLYHQGVIDMDDFTICWLYEKKKYGK